MIARQDLHDESLALFNMPVISGLEIVRLIGYAETDCDCYYIMMSRQGKEFWHSCVGGMYPLTNLKGQNYVKAWNGDDWDDIVRIDHVLELNGCVKQAQFKVVTGVKEDFRGIELRNEKWDDK